MHVTLKDGEQEWLWSIHPAAIPRVGETVWLAQAQLGIVHIVCGVQHIFDAGEQRVVVFLDRAPTYKTEMARKIHLGGS